MALVDWDDTATGGARVGGDGHRTVVWLWGDHDLLTVARVRTALTESVDGADRDVVVDLADVPYMNAAIIHSSMRCRALLGARGRRLTLRSPRSCPRRLLEVCELTELIETHRPR
jgi:anti-anti-sigma factor